MHFILRYSRIRFWEFQRSEPYYKSFRKMPQVAPILPQMLSLRVSVQLQVHQRLRHPFLHLALSIVT